MNFIAFTNGYANGAHKKHNVEEYLRDKEFLLFLVDSARNILPECSAEELAEFVYGSLEEAIDAFHGEYDAEDDDADEEEGEEE